MDLLKASRAAVACMWLGVCCCCHLGAQTQPAKTSAANPGSLVVMEFENRVKEYVKLHKKAQAETLPLKPTDSASLIDQRQHQLASKIRSARAQAEPGQIFFPEVTRLFKRLISTAFEGANGAHVRASLRHAEPVSGLHLSVNAEYPERTPLQSTPPSILLNLPDLPPELDYRIVGRHLILRDVGANLIVDYMPDAIPAS
jgi:hypothetical protein